MKGQMAISEAFALKVASIAHSKEKLIALMDELDAEKRSLRSSITLWMYDPRVGNGRSKAECHLKTKQLRDRIGFLMEERGYVREKIGKINGDQKALNRAGNRSVLFSKAFIAAAERMLPEKTFLEIEAKASMMLLQE